MKNRSRINYGVHGEEIEDDYNIFFIISIVALIQTLLLAWVCSAIIAQDDKMPTFSTQSEMSKSYKDNYSVKHKEHSFQASIH